MVLNYTYIYPNTYIHACTMHIITIDYGTVLLICSPMMIAYARVCVLLTSIVSRMSRILVSEFEGVGQQQQPTMWMLRISLLIHELTTERLLETHRQTRRRTAYYRLIPPSAGQRIVESRSCPLFHPYSDPGYFLQ